MDQPGTSGSGEQNARRRKENLADGDASAIALNEEQTGDIFKLDIDCCEEAFDYLPLEDLISVGKTCKRLQQVAGHCFQQNYSGETFHISKGGIYTYISGIKYNVQHFAPFIQRIWIEDEYGLRYFAGTQSKFRRLKQIEIWDFKSSDMDRLMKISMSKLEDLYIYKSDLNNDIHGIIDRCTKLKHLEIVNCTGESNWANCKYPTLEHFVFVSLKNTNFINIPAFLELNPNIRKFATNQDFLWEQRHMMTANIKLEDLCITINTDGETSEFVSTCDSLVKLYEHGFYKKIQVEILTRRYNQETINRLASLKGLNKLSVLRCDRLVTLSALNNLEELLFMGESHRIADIYKLPNALINLKRIHFVTASFDSIMPFIRRSVEMHTIMVESLEAGVHFDKETGIIDLPALNRERALLTPEQLAGVQKVTLYVEEKVYLATKWAFGGTDYEYIRLKREHRIVWCSSRFY